MVKIIGSMVAQEFAQLKKGEEGRGGGGEHVVPVKNGGRKRGGLGKRSKSKEQSGGSSVQGSLALDMLSWMMAHPYCMGELRQAKQFWELSSTLKESMVSGVNDCTHVYNKQHDSCAT